MLQALLWRPRHPREEADRTSSRDWPGYAPNDWQVGHRFVRVTWAHYYQRDAELSASLNGLPGARFTATGARPDRSAALLAAGGDIRLSRRVSLGMRVVSELSGNTRRVGGTAQLGVSF
ncbi:autotransporter domain-containing protein [Bosea sp. Root381]|uniref:autotransporter domain-containing protein n=1 Tax=Bosea sp. Root381 TaxID=1736524 RepID=UPI000A98ECDB|nr:autotransporter domain-containing protein [Bosea sp. Root381]